KSFASRTVCTSTTATDSACARTGRIGSSPTKTRTTGRCSCRCSRSATSRKNMNSQTQSPPLVDLKVNQPDQALFKSAINALNTAKAYDIDSPDMRDLAARELTKIKT